MSERAIMPLSDWQAILDAYRVKTETTDLIKSGELAALIATIETGGEEKITWVEGSFTPSEATNTYTVTHGLGVVPKYVVVRSSSDTVKSFSVSSTTGYQTVMLGIYTPYFTARVYPRWNSSTQSYCYRDVYYEGEDDYPGDVVVDINEETVTLRNGYSLSRGGAAFVNSAKYEWAMGY